MTPTLTRKLIPLAAAALGLSVTAGLALAAPPKSPAKSAQSPSKSAKLSPASSKVDLAKLNPSATIGGGDPRLEQYSPAEPSAPTVAKVKPWTKPDLAKVTSLKTADILDSTELDPAARMAAWASGMRVVSRFERAEQVTNAGISANDGKDGGLLVATASKVPAGRTLLLSCKVWINGFNDEGKLAIAALGYAKGKPARAASVRAPYVTEQRSPAGWNLEQTAGFATAHLVWDTAAGEDKVRLFVWTEDAEGWWYSPGDCAVSEIRP